MPVESDAFPAPRGDRPGPAPGGAIVTGGAASLVIPQIRLFSFQVEVSTQNRCSVAVSQRFRENVVILDASWFSLAIAAPLPPGLFSILLSDSDDGARTDSATLTAPSGVSIFDPIQYATPGAAPVERNVVTLAGAQSTVVHHRSHRIAYYGGSGDKFVKIVLRSSTGGVGQFDVGGFIRIAEGVPANQVPGFL